ncbi:hypothetical protein FA95DRAFT_1497229 [Auriscalpium vulgare]|uniref:Uncharacterized protein n=1 Tax=Auriscalpium vulgare TaxID=40419 RepID=A0ACB8RKN9_9AGAM|nr:hypothetical protein FA95DRAFT_1497229 [Auriscalpium vulgare]
MSDASSASPVTPEQHHLRLDSNSSTTSTGSTPASYPVFNLYPNPFFASTGGVDTDPYAFTRHTPPPSQKPVGLLDPKNSLLHHGLVACTQIPKLRMACQSGTNGQRSMWSHCEQCGAIEMIDPDY